MRPIHLGAFGALLALCAALLSVPQPAAQAVESRPKAVLWKIPIGDPSVARVGRRVVVVSTGAQVTRAYKDPGRRWRWAEPALTERPTWARAEGGIWAADIARVKNRWVLYYAVPVAGLGPYGRCIGVAVAKRALDPFKPVGDRPLVCPSRARVPTAADPVNAPDMPSKGIIDPSLYVENGRAYLLYKTDGKPSSIRLLPLNRKGRQLRGNVDPANPSVELVRSADVIENPVIVKRPKSGYFLFASEGDFARCSYRQTWRQSASLTDWSTAQPQVLLDAVSTGGLCGPAGGDVLTSRGKVDLYFHGWVKAGTKRPAPFDFWGWPEGHGGQRAMYVARLKFPGGVPTVVRYLR